MDVFIKVTVISCWRKLSVGIPIRLNGRMLQDSLEEHDLKSAVFARVLTDVFMIDLWLISLEEHHKKKMSTSDYLESILMLLDSLQKQMDIDKSIII